MYQESCKIFFPGLFGCEITSLEQQLFLQPIRFGGLGLSVPTASAVDLFTASRHATRVIVGAIKQACQFQISVHDDIVFTAQKAYHQIYMETYHKVVKFFTIGNVITHDHDS